MLRQAIADHYTASGVPTGPEQILVTSGAQHAFVLALHELSASGDRVLIESPTYPVALDAIRAARRIPGPIGLPGPDLFTDNGSDGDRLDGDGGSAWDAELIAATMTQTAPRLAYLIPDFQNPTGALMDQDTRERIVRAARSNNTLLLIDESFRDVPFPDHAPLPPRMASLDGTGLRVLSLGSLSKSIWGGLRIGWIRAAPALINRLAAARALGDMSGPVVDQLIAVHFLADPHRAFDQQRRRLADGAAVPPLPSAKPCRSGRSADPPVEPVCGWHCLSVRLRVGPACAVRRCAHRSGSALRTRRHDGVLPAPAVHPAAGQAGHGCAPTGYRGVAGRTLARVRNAGMAGLKCRDDASWR